MGRTRHLLGRGMDGPGPGVKGLGKLRWTFSAILLGMFGRVSMAGFHGGFPWWVSMVGFYGGLVLVLGGKAALFQAVVSCFVFFFLLGWIGLHCPYREGLDPRRGWWCGGLALRGRHEFVQVGIWNCDGLCWCEVGVCWCCWLGWALGGGSSWVWLRLWEMLWERGEGYGESPTGRRKTERGIAGEWSGEMAGLGAFGDEVLDEDE